MGLVTVLNAFTTPRTAEAAVRLVFEDLAAAQAEAGRPEPTTVDGLPPALRRECLDLDEVYRPPNGLWLAYLDGRPAGCAGLVSRALGTAELRHLHVRRGGPEGIRRVLVEHAHRHAARHWFTRVVVSVAPGRTDVVEFHRGLGYTDAEPYDLSPMSMVHLQRPIAHA